MMWHESLTITQFILDELYKINYIIWKFDDFTISRFILNELYWIKVWRWIILNKLCYMKVWRFHDLY
jgi:hypothetical protein